MLLKSGAKKSLQADFFTDIITKKRGPVNRFVGDTGKRSVAALREKIPEPPRGHLPFWISDDIIKP